MRNMKKIIAWMLGLIMLLGLGAAAGESALPEISLDIPPRCSDAQLERILEALAVLKIKMTLDLHVLLDRHMEGISDMDVLIVSAYWSDMLEERARKLRQMGNSVTWLKIGGGA